MKFNPKDHWISSLMRSKSFWKDACPSIFALVVSLILFSFHKNKTGWTVHFLWFHMGLETAMGLSMWIIISFVFISMARQLVTDRQRMSWVFDEFNDALRTTYGREMTPSMFRSITREVPFSLIGSGEQILSGGFTFKDDDVNEYVMMFIDGEAFLCSRKRGDNESADYVRVNPLEKTSASGDEQKRTFTLGAPTPVDGGSDIFEIFESNHGYGRGLR